MNEMDWKEMSIKMMNNIEKYLECCAVVYDNGDNSPYTTQQLDLMFNEIMVNIKTVKLMVEDEEGSPAYLLMNHYASELDEIIEGEEE